MPGAPCAQFLIAHLNALFQSADPRFVVRNNSSVTSIERVVAIKRRGDEDAPWRYWMTRPFAERLAMVEELRRELHGRDDEFEPRLLRIYRIIHRP